MSLLNFLHTPGLKCILQKPDGTRLGFQGGTTKKIMKKTCCKVTNSPHHLCRRLHISSRWHWSQSTTTTIKGFHGGHVGLGPGLLPLGFPLSFCTESWNKTAFSSAFIFCCPGFTHSFSSCFEKQTNFMQSVCNRLFVCLFLSDPKRQEEGKQEEEAGQSHGILITGDTNQHTF